MIRSCAGRVHFHRFLERGHNGGVEIGHAGSLFLGQSLDELAVAGEDLVISPLEIRLAGHVVERGGLYERDPHARYVALEGFDQVRVSLGIDVKDLLIERPVAGVVHAEHHGDDCGLVRKHIALEAVVHAPAATPGDPIATPARMNEGNAHRRKARHDKGFHKRRVESLVGDAVAIKDDPIAVLDRERPSSPGARNDSEKQGQGQEYTADPSDVWCHRATSLVRVSSSRTAGYLQASAGRAPTSLKIYEREPVRKVLGQRRHRSARQRKLASAQFEHTTRLVEILGGDRGLGRTVGRDRKREPQRILLRYRSSEDRSDRGRDRARQRDRPDAVQVRPINEHLGRVRPPPCVEHGQGARIAHRE